MRHEATTKPIANARTTGTTIPPCTVQTPAAAVAAGSPDVDAPRVPLSHLTGAAADEVREIGRRQLDEYDRRPDPSGLFGSSGGPDRMTREEVRPRTVAFYVYDEDAVTYGAAWHRY